MNKLLMLLLFILFYLNHGYNSNSRTTSSILFSNRIDYDNYINEVRNGRIIRIASRVQYDGTDFKGWQEQDKSVRTIQGVLSNALTKRFNIGSRIVVIGASRTDHGVHSNGQAIHFDVTDNIMNTITSSSNDGIKHLEYTLNRMLPDDIKLYNMSIAPFSTINSDLWHARKSAIGKLYSYRFCHNTFTNPIKRRYVAPCRRMDMKTFNDCLQLYQGLHDFKAFADRVDHTTKEYEDKGKTFNTTRYVNSINLIHENYDNDDNDGYYRIDIHLESAMYKMIRNMVGTAMTIANGGMDRDQLLLLLNAENGLTRNDNKAKSAPAEGLCLEHVYYDNF